ncbi:tyrosine-type recombinase/integrase [Bremerella alba]|uniref:Tyrosine recombinase XerC n=1 Tax=Bremerella alba TaxID=980252 RepID=A0A7V8V9B4_9BACT|nr:site-specific integrase [Bremerella alba]MBA2117327.1 Tyrosine recombinase XerC [Bremerella alba]
MKVWQKQTVRYELNGKTVPKDTPKAKRVTILSKRFYGSLKTLSGKTRQVALCEDKDASITLLRRLQTQEDRDKAVGVDRHAKEQRRPIEDHLSGYEKHLRSKANTERYVVLTMGRIRRLLDAVKAKAINDLESSRIANTLSSWRNRKKKPVSVVTSNHYARAIKGFSRWLWIERRTPDDTLSPLRLLNADVDRKRVRRALTADEVKKLIETTEKSGKRLRGLIAKDRAMLYTLATYTGLRASELASLKVTSFDIENGTVTVEAGYSKRRRKDVLPLHASLIERLRPWLESKAKAQVRTLFVTDIHHAADMMRSDLKRANIDYVDASGRYADFHSLRHTFISSLAKNGVHPSKAKELARHSTITLTMDVYSHVETDELREAISVLPDLLS